MNEKTVSAEHRPHNTRSSVPPSGRPSIVDQLEDVALAVNVARAFARDDDPRVVSEETRALLSLCDVVEAFTDSLKQGQR